MKEQFINKLACQPMDMSQARARTFIASTVQKLRAERPDEDVFGDPLPKMQVIGDVAVIPVYGVLMLALPDWVKQWGLSITDINDVVEEITAAMNDPRVSLIVLDFDSAGGWSIAGQKLFDFVERMRTRGTKPIFSWCADGADVCSAAFHGATPSLMFLTGPYACSVGCIGTYLAVLDDTEFWKMMGITIIVERSGELKGMGEDGFSAPQLAFLKASVDQCGSLFRSHVTRYRTELDPADMEGQWYSGDQAARRCFTQGLAADLPAAIQKFRQQL